MCFVKDFGDDICVGCTGNPGASNADPNGVPCAARNYTRPAESAARVMMHAVTCCGRPAKLKEEPRPGVRAIFVCLAQPLVTCRIETIVANWPFGFGATNAICTVGLLPHTSVIGTVKGVIDLAMR